MTVTTRRQRRERELRRRKREKRGPDPARGGGGRGWIGGVVVAVVVIAILLGLRQAGVLSTGPAPSGAPLPTPAAIASNDPALGTHEKEVGRDHVNPGAPVTFAALPPTSGNHWAAPAGPVKAAIYDQLVPFEATTHNLEHGGIVIVYNGLSADDTQALKDFVRRTLDQTKYKKVLVEPYPGLQGAAVTATAWTWRLDLQGFDALSLTKFIQAHYDGPDAPEPGASW